jgi:signal transduction histidine kinase
LVLIAVILPTHILVTLLESQLTTPVLEQEMRQIGINAAKNLSAQIESSHVLQAEKASSLLEKQIQELLFLQPSIQQIDIFKKQEKGEFVLAASNVEYDDPTERDTHLSVSDTVETHYKTEDNGVSVWEIILPIRHHGRASMGPVLGAVRMEMSLKPVHTISRAFWKITVVAALVNLTLLLFALSFFLRRTISNDRLLRQAETQNEELSTQLREAERQLMLNEKLAVMGQLTASFAHEIGTPLNAVSGHLQLLQEDFKQQSVQKSWIERLDIISGQLLKIEQIVKNFLQSTAKPTSQSQLLDLNQMADRVIGITRPRIDTLGVQVKMDLEKGLGPIRAVPLEIEQIFVNLLNNSLDSIQSKKRMGASGPFVLQLQSRHFNEAMREWAEVSVYDTGEGITKTNLKQVFRPFFTTKRAGEGTGLGLAICQEIASKYNGALLIDSREGQWTKVSLRLPYRTNL